MSSRICWWCPRHGEVVALDACNPKQGETAIDMRCGLCCEPVSLAVIDLEIPLLPGAFPLGGQTPLSQVSHPDLGAGVKPCPTCKVMAQFAHKGGDAYGATQESPSGTITLSCRCSMPGVEWDQAPEGGCGCTFEHDITCLARA